MKLRLQLVFVLLWAGIAHAAAPAPVPCEVLVPVLDAHQTVVKATTPDGQSYPVFSAAPAGPLLTQVRQQLDSSFAQQVLKLDRYARNFVISRRKLAGKPVEDALTAPMYLLLSTEEGGFPRFGFWLQHADGQRQLLLRQYVDLVVNERSIRDGDFEEIFSHELGHLILKSLTGALPAGQARNMHLSMSVTDYPTAFDEGYAEHFQPLVRGESSNEYLRKLNRGTAATDLETMWLSATDGQLRTDGVKRNIFIHRKALPDSALDPMPDLYRVFVDDQASTAFDQTRLKNAQEMMASEGVIATLFYRIVEDEKLQNAYREPAFYTAFTLAPAADPRQVITSYENVNLKLFAAILRVPRWSSDRPPIIAILENYAELFPDEARRVNQIFIETTWGAVTSRELATAMQRASGAGHRGDIGDFRRQRPFALLDSIVTETVAKRPLDANLGPELWIANTDFKIASAYWETDRTEPLTMNLNTASVAELMTIPGVDLRMARAIIQARDATGFFRSLDDLAAADVPPAVIDRVRQMQSRMKKVKEYHRE